MKWKWLLLTPLLAGIGGVIGGMVTVAAVKPASPAFYSPELALGTARGNENLIEVFSDGFDAEVQRPLLENNPNFKDYYFFPNFFTQGAPTHIGKTSELGGFENYNAFSIMARSAHGSLYDATFYENEMINAMKVHFDNLKSFFAKKYLISNYDLLTPNSALTSAAYVQQQIGDIALTTTPGAFEAVNSAFGTSPVAPSWRAFPYFAKVATSAPANQLGAHVFISDMTTHGPKVTSSDGSYTTAASLQDVSLAVLHGLEVINQKLLAIKPSATDAYDASMVVVYGDHSEHTKVKGEGINGYLSHAHSGLLIKFPFTHRERLTIVDDKVIFGGELNDLLLNIFTAVRGGLSGSDLMTVYANPLYNLGRQLYTYYQNDATFYPTKYDPATDELVQDDLRAKIVYNKDTLEADLSLLNQTLKGKVTNG